MDRQSLTKQIMDFILAKNQKFILVHGKFWWGGKKTSFYFIGGSFKSSWLSTHRLKQPAVLWSELEVRHFSTIDAAWLVILHYRVLVQKEEHIGYSRWIFLRLKVIGSQCIQISVFPQKHSMLTWFIIAEIDFASLRSGKNKGKVALVKVFVSSRPEPEAIPLGG